MNITNIAIIAHVDHGKTTLVDAILKQSKVFRDSEDAGELIMDSGDQEKERGITIQAKNCAVMLDDNMKVNIIDTPGHSDFGSEVERVLGMADGAILLVDAFEGPMPQTRFVLKHALSRGLKILVVLNKIDKPNVKVDDVLGKIFDLFVELGASDEQCDFPYVFAIGREGRAGTEPVREKLANDLAPLFDLIKKNIKSRPIVDGSSQMQVTSLLYDKFLGRLAVGRINRGEFKIGDSVIFVDKNNNKKTGRVQKLFTWQGIKRIESESAKCNDIIAIAGIPEATIGDTICDQSNFEELKRGKIEEPTLEVVFYPNSSPFAGKEGKYVTSKQISERLDRELLTNVGLRITSIDEGYKVAGRGELHIGVLLESMRREEYEVAVGKPQVIRNEQGEEPYEYVFIDVPEGVAGKVIEQLGKRKGEMKHMNTDSGRTKIEYMVPTRGLLGFRSEFQTLTAGEGILTSAFSHFGPYVGEISTNRNGAMVSGFDGECLGYALFNLQERATLFVYPGTKIYEGMIIGECNRDEELVVNPTKGKKLTNVRASGNDENIMLIPPKKLTLEQSLEWIADDELLEITPHNLRLRKKYLKEGDRRKAKSKSQ